MLLCRKSISLTRCLLYVAGVYKDSRTGRSAPPPVSQWTGGHTVSVTTLPSSAAEVGLSTANGVDRSPVASAMRSSAMATPTATASSVSVPGSASSLSSFDSTGYGKHRGYHACACF